MNTIEKIYTNYDGLLEEFSEEVIQSRYAVFYEEIEEFAKSLGIREKIQISESLLSHAVLDYFTDISRLKHFHQAKHINSLKVISYETYWLLRRKPIQILVEDETSDAMAFLNEKFVFSRIAKYLMGDGKRVILSPETKKGFLNYLDSLFYYLKYRNYDAVFYTTDEARYEFMTEFFDLVEELDVNALSENGQSIADLRAAALEG